MNPLSRRVDINKASDWILRALDVADLKSEEIKARLIRGTATVIAPAKLTNERLYAFGVGGVTRPGEHIHHEGYDIVEVVNSSSDLTAIVRKIACSICYFHDPLRQPNEVSMADGPSISLDGQILYVARLDNLSDEELSRLIRRNTLSWHFLMLCAHDAERKYSGMKELVLNANSIVVGVYDGESYLVWKVASSAT